MFEICVIIREKFVGFGYFGGSLGYKGVCYNILLCGLLVVSVEFVFLVSESIIYYMYIIL